ncbi:MAG TPA: ArsC/Spx/MgsR family protein [Rhodocyclaceae bacterium]|jgi:nitrogenase-associated protein
MAVIQFYEKSGCSGNRKQKAMLETAGHEVQAKDLRDVCWTRERLLSFLAGMPVADWFNKAATAVKEGTIVPEELDEDTALGLLQENPLLIRRPLMEAAGSRMVGFDTQAVNDWVGLGNQVLPTRNMESCANHDHDHGDDGKGHHCHDPHAAAKSH